MNNLELWEKVRAVPENAIKPINGGRLKGMSDINPTWRLQKLTETFGPCGFGWKYVITKQWIENGANGEVSAFTNIDLYVKMNDVWSEAIPGTGGSAFVANEKNGPYTSDEVYKMSLTDAISVACKALGIGADVYWGSGATKYSNKTDAPVNHTPATSNTQPTSPAGGKVCTNCGATMIHKTGTSAKGPWSGYFCPNGKEKGCKPIFE